MKLRNKKARNVYTLGEDVHIAHTDGGRIEVEIVLKSGGFAREYFDSLAEFNDEWEDYKLPDPLIKDEKIRNAVRAWAEALDLRWFRKCRNDNSYTSKLSGFDSLGVCYTIVFGLKDLYNDDKTQNSYTLEELCGSEE